ncbi:unnamed protein product, partial [Mesorhabditis spiculigera]
MSQLTDLNSQDRPSTSATPPADASLVPPIVVKEAGLELIKQLIAKVDVEMANVAQKIAQVKSARKLADTRHELKSARLQVTLFLPPYFRNRRRFAPPMNREALEKRQNNAFDPLVRPQRPWGDKEIKMLKDAVKNELVEHQLLEHTRYVELLTAKIKAAGVETGEEEVAEWRLERDKRLGIIEYTKTNGPTITLPAEHIKWDRIATRAFKGNRTADECRREWINVIDPKVNTKKWDDTELKKLSELTKGREGFINWLLITEQLGTNRRPFDVFQKYQSELANRVGRPWTAEEDEKLLGIIELVRCGSNIPWDKVAHFMPGRNIRELKNHSRQIDVEVKHGRWTDDEDLILLCAVEKYGHHSWPKVATMTPTRGAQQCRQRWKHLSLKHTPGYFATNWKMIEDEKLVAGIEFFGKGKWKEICYTLLPDRTPDSCRMRYCSLQTTKIRLAANQPELVRAAHNSAVGRALGASSKVEKLYDRLDELSGNNPQVMESARNRGLEYLAKKRENCKKSMDAETLAKLEALQKEIDEKYANDEIADNPELSARTAAAILERITLTDEDMALWEQNKERRRDADRRRPKTQKLRGKAEGVTSRTRRLRTPLKLGPFERNINIAKVRNDPDKLRAALYESLAQYIRRSDKYFFHKAIAGSEDLQRAMRAGFSAAMSNLLPRDADAPEELRAPNYATFSLLGKLEAERADLFAKASQNFPIAKPLTSVPKKFMRNLMQRTYDADTALWRDEDEGKWRESSALAGANGATADAPTDAPTSSNNTNDQTDEAPGPSLLNKVSAAIHCLPSTSSSSSSTGMLPSRGTAIERRDRLQKTFSNVMASRKSDVSTGSRKGSSRHGDDASSISTSSRSIIPISPAPVRGLKRIPAPASSPLELYKRPRKMEP